MGELYGHHTLTGLLASVGVKSNQKNKHWQKISYKTLWDWVLLGFKQEFLEEFQTLLSKDNSQWSRENITVIGDESVFRQWLEGVNKANDEHYLKSFSGQYCRSVWGYKVSVWGVMMHDRFYPLVMRILKKDETCADVAKNCFEELADFLNKASKGHQKPTMFVSLDSGFNNKVLLAAVEQKGFSPICVPKDSHLVEYEGEKLNIKQLKEVFKKKEERAKRKKEKTNLAKNITQKPAEEPFVWRVKVNYQMHQRTVTLLFFRLKDSPKVSVAFCFDKKAYAKTIRRHWFARTSIEQFFRLMKTTLRIQESKSEDYEGFVKKFSLTCLKACFVLQLRNRVRKRIQSMKKATWANIRRILADDLGIEWLKKTVEKLTFCIT